MSYKLYSITHNEYEHILTSKDCIYFLNKFDKQALKSESTVLELIKDVKSIKTYDVEQAIFNYKKKEVILKDHHNLLIANMTFDSKASIRTFSKFFWLFKVEKPDGSFYNNLSKILVIISIAFFWAGLTPTLGNSNSGKYNIRSVQGIRQFMEGLNEYISQNFMVVISAVLFFSAMGLLLASIDYFKTRTWRYLNIKNA
jgi:hypothetical protein